ncbi:MAG: PLAT/LH2 domain-containing protein [Halobacteriota archaeon]
MPDTFTLYAVGDSVTWGQGLEHHEKFASLVYEELAADGDTLDPAHIYARSGAIIGIHRAADAEPLADVADSPLSRTAEHEVPWSRPTVREQVDELADAVSEPSDVDLLIIGGGINDVDVRTLIDPFTETYDGEVDSLPNASENDPIPAEPDYELEDLIRTYCYDDMRTLVRTARDCFPESVVVVTGYFPVVSPLTDFDVLRDWRLLFHDAFDWLAAEFIAQSLYFNRRALYWLRRAVAELNADSDACGPGVAFAHPSFGIENSLEAPDPWLWGVDADDPVRATRMEGCKAIGADGATDSCPIASTGHPNPAGARQYADAIVDRYRHTRRSSLRDSLKQFGDAQSGNSVTLRTVIERYGFDPKRGARSFLAHDLIDSVSVTITTADEGTNRDVFLSLTPARQWYLDHAHYNDFEAGDEDSYSVDPALDGLGRLRLRDVERVRLSKEGIFDEWTIERVVLELNGVAVFEWTGSATLEGSDTVVLPGYPKQEVA